MGIKSIKKKLGSNVWVMRGRQAWNDPKTCTNDEFPPQFSKVASLEIIFLVVVHPKGIYTQISNFLTTNFNAVFSGGPLVCKYNDKYVLDGISSIGSV